MIWLFGSLAYAGMGLACARVLAGHFAWSMFNTDKVRYGRRGGDYSNPSWHYVLNRPNGEQWFGAWCAALALSVLWPCVLLLVRIKLPKVGAERAAEIKAREIQIAEAEERLGIR